MKYTYEEVKTYRKRLLTLETIVSLPAKIVVIGVALFAVFPLMEMLKGTFKGEVPFFGTVTNLKIVTFSVIAYSIATNIIWFFLFITKRGRTSIQFMKFLMAVTFALDAYFLTMWLYILGTEPPEGNLFWLYGFLIIRNVILFQEILSNIIFTASIIFGYAGAVLISSRGHEESITLRVVIIMLVTLSAWGINEMYRRRKQEEDEAKELTIRSQRLKLAGIIAKEAAHSLKNPLTIINNAAYILSTKTKDVPGEILKQVETIASEVKRADRVMEELMNYENLAAGHIDKTDINREIGNILEDLKNEINDRGIIIIKELESGLPRLMIDGAQLRQVLSNIVLNACQAIENGQGIITVTSGMDEEGKIKVDIQDTGKGIEPGMINKIFKAYYTTKKEGTGIGLSIVHTILQAYNGSVSVSSEVGKGTRFTLLFPTRTEK